MMPAGNDNQIVNLPLRISRKGVDMLQTPWSKDICKGMARRKNEQEDHRGSKTSIAYEAKEKGANLDAELKPFLAICGVLQHLIYDH
ncbi:hypothetical protein Tco_0906590 [Tanacetum coccineum]|uniref:Uncharacterized protein n=1 Tax=Tanacetum coccineum TaxID=301880 RepID=A0ABQ5CH79_9ASTR